MLTNITAGQKMAQQIRKGLRKLGEKLERLKKKGIFSTNEAPDIGFIEAYVRYSQIQKERDLGLDELARYRLHLIEDGLILADGLEKQEEFTYILERKAQELAEQYYAIDAYLTNRGLPFEEEAESSDSDTLTDAVSLLTIDG